MTGVGVTQARPAVAVIGIATRFPQADSLAAFRANLRAGRDSVRPIPAERMSSTGLDPKQEYPELGYLDRIDLFDHEYFRLSRREAELIDPQHRLALQLTQEALENAGYAPSQLRDSPTAVIFSSPSNGYLPLVREPGTLSMIGNIPCGLPTRISHLFGFTGPCYGVDTGCNGSLVAIHQACRELRDGDADYAVVGGVSLRHIVAPAASVADFPGIHSPTARSRAFDRAADGAGSGEGGAAVLLTTLDRALEEGAFIHGVIRGSAVVHNGQHSATISTPSAHSQAEVITKAWRSAALDPKTAGYLETHGSGTKLGDAVETEGLALARPGERQTLRVGSVKTNIGHLDHAAGIAGLVKAVLSVQHGELYPSLHFEEAAEEVDLEGARLEVVTSLQPWEDDVRRAGVSSFSLGGVNAHCVVEQPPASAAAQRSVTEDGTPQLVAVSGRTAADLLAVCERLSLELRDNALPLADIARTLNEGRDHHPYRTALVARDAGDLAVRLAAGVTWQRLDDQKTPLPRAHATPRVVFLLSGEAEADARSGGDPLPDRLPVPADRAAMVRGQLTAYRLLRQAGIVPDGLMSSGISRFTVRHLRNALRDADTQALRAARDSQDPSVAGEPLRPERLYAAAEDQLANGPVVFVELSSRGELAERLTTYLDGRPDATVLTLPSSVRDSAHGVLEVLAGLYEWGVNPDWSALRADPRAGRVPLPGHPMHGVRCWARPLGEVLSFDGFPGAAPRTDAPAVGADTTVSAGQPDVATTQAPTAPRQAPTQPTPQPPVASATATPSAAPVPAAQPADVPREPAAGATDSVLPWLRAELKELLHADEVGDEADYFAIGGNSVIAFQLVDRVRDRYDVRLKMVDIYDHPVVSTLADAIRQRQPQPPVEEAPPAASVPAPPAAVPPAEPTTPRATPQADQTPVTPRAERAPASRDADELPPIVPGGELMLSYGQERMWFHHQLDPTTTLYNLPNNSRHRGPLNIEALRLAWEDLAQRHQVLRSNFVEVEGRPQLVIRPELGDFFQYVDVSGEPDPGAAAMEYVARATHFVFDVARDPMVRATVVRVAEDDYVFSWCMHHAINDGWAPQIQMKDLLQFYAARLENRVAELPPLPVQYSDYARWQRELLEGSWLDGELDYWRERLSDPPALTLPTDRPRAARMDFAGAAHGFTIPAELVRRLRQVGGEETATLFMVLLTGLKLLLSRWSGQRDIVVGTPTIGRSRPELWELLGFFNNTVALRSDLSGDPTFRELLRQVRGVVLGALEHQEIPFDKIVREVVADRDPSRNPVFDVMYVHQTLPPNFAFGENLFEQPQGTEDQPRFPGLPPGTAKFDISVVVAERANDDELEVVVEYATQLFDGDTIAAMFDGLVELLHAVADDRDARYAALPAGRPAPAAEVEAAQPVAAPVSSWLELREDPAHATGSEALDLDVEALRGAFEDLATRHEVLRTRSGHTAEAGSALGTGFLTTADVSDKSEPLEAIREIAQAEAALVLDAASGRQLHALLARTGPHEQVLVVTTHRSAYDGSQPELLYRELLEFYAARTHGRRPELPALPQPYEEYAARLPKLPVEEQLAYWRAKLTATPDTSLPLDRARPAHGTGATAAHSLRLPAELAHALGGSSSQSLLAGVSALLSLRAGSGEAVVGLTGVDPAEPATTTLVGPFARTVPLRVDLTDDPSFEALTERVRRTVTDARRHQDVPLADIARAAGLPQEPGRAPLFDVTYDYRALPAGLGSAAGFQADLVRWPGTDSGSLSLPSERSEHDLGWTVTEGPGQDELYVSLTYRTELFDAPTVRALADELVALLRAATHAPSTPLSGLWPHATTSHAD